ncbi:hypothetical protein K1T35_18005 [Pseudonocardia sp. DSM 110487]|uniref:hypothetical protein n=1 Tax=Pseudonocardia sp. DSM 110487 TaxID=2865833 RepID=UPI001C69B2A1|nr:hypothetical protein [Pseudonocardia sp. DSM 110487]QYN38927.1 hypothetical protein K1T35_18005 [Pseudonocardia sp. DSM 110487]
MTNLDPRPDLEVLDGGQACTAAEVLEPRPPRRGPCTATFPPDQLPPLPAPPLPNTRLLPRE